MRKYFIACMLIVATATTISARTLVVSWNPNSEVDLAGYRLYGSDTSGQYDFNNPLVEIPVGTETTTIETDKEFFVLTAFDTSGKESDPSKEVNLKPLSPEGLKIVVQFIFEGG